MNIFPIQKLSIKIIPAILILNLLITSGCNPSGVPPEKAKEQNTQSETPEQKNSSGLPKPLADKQFFGPVPIPTVEEAAAQALAKADEAFSAHFTQTPKGKVRMVPAEFNTIQEAINASSSGDTVIVGPGTYYEQLSIKKGIRLVSAQTADDSLKGIDGTILRLPERALLTIIDGSRSKPSPQGMLDFDIGAGRDTIIDGFTIQNLPVQNHHIPGHAHAINLRGSSPTIMNCLVQNNGSTGIGSHVIYHDQQNPIEERDFRKENIQSEASGLLYRNIVRNNLGRGIGCNHFSSPIILGNEVYDNDDTSLGEMPGPGIGIKHGASPTVIGNIVYSNPGGGILIKEGESQGTYPVDMNSNATVESNLIFKNGTDRPALSCQSSGFPEKPVRFIGNYIFDFGGVGIGMGKNSYGVVLNNFLANGQFIGVAVNNSTAYQVSGNTIAKMESSAFTFVNNAAIKELKSNRVFDIKGTPFVVQNSSIEGEAKD